LLVDCTFIFKRYYCPPEPVSTRLILLIGSTAATGNCWFWQDVTKTKAPIIKRVGIVCFDK
jgi:hypothetical protein